MTNGPIEAAIIQTWLTVHVTDLMRISEELREKKANSHCQMSATSMDRCRAADYISIGRNETSLITDCRGCNNATRGGERCDRREFIPKTNHHRGCSD